jgi:hypothetical protein
VGKRKGGTAATGTKGQLAYTFPFRTESIVMYFHMQPIDKDYITLASRSFLQRSS